MKRLLPRFGLLPWLTLLLLPCFFLTAAYALTPRERQVIKTALGYLDEAIAHDAERTKDLELARIAAESADAAARMAAESAQAAGTKAETAEKRAKEQHKELMRCAGENAKMREIVKQVSGPWWFPGGRALLYGIKKSVISLFVIIAGVVVIGLLLKIFAPGVFALFGVAGKAVSGLGGRALGAAKRILPKRKPKE